MLAVTVAIAALSAGAAALAPDDRSGVNRIYFGTDTRIASILQAPGGQIARVLSAHAEKGN